jgi:glycosyltransferase involved in cell wall biosynthesis
VAGRVAFVIDELEIGGSQRQLLLMATGLRHRGWHVEVVCLQPILTLADEFVGAGVAVSLIPKRRRVDIPLVVQLQRHLRARRIDLVHAFSSTAEFFGAVASRAAGCRFVASVRNSAEPLPLMHRVAKRFAGHLAHAVVANSTAGSNDAVASGLISRSKVHVIPNALDAARLASITSARNDGSRPPSIAADAIVIALVGRLVTQKGYDVAIAIAERLRRDCPRAVFVVAGEGPLRARLERDAAAAGLGDAFVLLGEVEDVARVLGHADVYLSASRWEGMSNAIMEAMAASLPVVASAVGGTPELVRHGETGFLFSSGNVEEAQAHLARLIGDRELRAALGAAGRQLVVNRHDRETLVSSIERLYVTLLHPEAA